MKAAPYLGPTALVYGVVWTLSGLGFSLGFTISGGGKSFSFSINAKKPRQIGKASSGFGAAPAPSLDKKLRSLSSGNTGSGTKALRKAANSFDELRKKFSVEQCRDVYVRSPMDSPTTFWFVGKLVAAPNTSHQHAAIAQKRLIFEYSKQELRPQNMGGKFASQLELWLAPGDSEMDVVRNSITFEAVKGSASDLPEDFDLSAIGYNPEIYVGDERTKGGLRVQRDEHGGPVKPVFDVNESA